MTQSSDNYPAGYGNNGQAWWVDEECAQGQLFGLVESVTTLQGWRATNAMRYAALYGNWDMFSQATTCYGRMPNDLRYGRLNFNIVQSCVDTVVAKHAANQPRIEVLTEAGDWSQQIKAKRSTRFLAGVFDSLKLYRIMPLVLRDATIFGDGFIKFYSRLGKIRAERVFPGEIVVDEAEAVNGTPRQAFQVRYISKDVLRAEFPEYALDIDGASSGDFLASSGPHIADMVKVVEAWHLPSSPKAGDGRHCIAISGCVLHWEPWEFETFPWVKVSWTPAIQGWYSQGLADQLMGIQLEISKLLKRAQLSMHLMSIPYYLVEAGSKITKSHLNNEVGHIVSYIGTKPEARVNQSVHPEIFQQIQLLMQSAYELSGISRLEAQARKPAGLDSRPAIAEYSDVTSERHAYFSMQWQEAFRDAAWQIFRCASQTPGYATKGTGHNYMQPIKWADCQLGDDDYTFQVAVGNLLPTTPAGKKNFVQDLAQAGILTPDQALRLLQYPDIEALTGEMTAGEEYIDWLLEQLLEKEHYVPPEPLAPLKKAVLRVGAEYLRAIPKGAPESALNNLRTWLRDADDLLNPPPPPPGPMALPGAPPPGAPPGMPPMPGAPPPNIPPTGVGAPPMPGQQPPMAA